MLCNKATHMSSGSSVLGSQEMVRVKTMELCLTLSWFSLEQRLRSLQHWNKDHLCHLIVVYLHLSSRCAPKRLAAH